MSALLHALSALNPNALSLASGGSAVENDPVPCTSLPCRWKPPRKRKESALRISDASFEKHEYSKPVKKKMSSVEDFDPRPQKYRGQVKSRLPDLLEKIRGEQLCISFLFDKHFRCEISQQPCNENLPDDSGLRATVMAFKKTLEMTPQMCREMERNTCEQSNSPLWFSVRRHRITSSLFGSVLSHKPSTPPDNLVLRIIQPRTFSTPATAYGLTNEKIAIQEYQKRNQDSIVSSSGVIINPNCCFLGASPDGAVYNPSNTLEPFGFLEVKCPYSARDVTPVEACHIEGFYCTLNSEKHLQLKTTHHYYAQVQGQMALGERSWCDFVVYTPFGISVQHIVFDEAYWRDKLLPKLTSFYDNCVAPELVSPLHSLGLPMRDLKEMSV